MENKYSLYMKITICLLVLLNQTRDNACELVSSLSAYERSMWIFDPLCLFFIGVSPQFAKQLNNFAEWFHAQKYFKYFYVKPKFNTLNVTTPSVKHF